MAIACYVFGVSCSVASIKFPVKVPRSIFLQREKKALFFRINKKKSKHAFCENFKIREDHVRKYGSWNTRFILVSVALTEKRLAVSDNTRPVMSKTCLIWSLGFSATSIKI